MGCLNQVNMGKKGLGIKIVSVAERGFQLQPTINNTY